MKISKKACDALYRALYDEIMDLRVQLKLSNEEDFAVAQVVNAIWARQKRALKLPEYL